MFEHYLFAGAPSKQEAAGMVGVPTQNELLGIFSDLRVLQYEEDSLGREWGVGKPQPLVRLLAQKNG